MFPYKLRASILPASLKTSLHTQIDAVLITLNIFGVRNYKAAIFLQASCISVPVSFHDSFSTNLPVTSPISFPSCLPASFPISSTKPTNFSASPPPKAPLQCSLQVSLQAYLQADKLPYKPPYMPHYKYELFFARFLDASLQQIFSEL